MYTEEMIRMCVRGASRVLLHDCSPNKEIYRASSIFLFMETPFRDQEVRWLNYDWH